MLQTYIQTYRPSDEAGPRGAFAPKNEMVVNYYNFLKRLREGIKNLVVSDISVNRWGGGRSQPPDLK